MTEIAARCVREEPRFFGLERFDRKIWLSSPTMHGEELEYVKRAYETNWMTTAGENVERLEELAASYIGVKHAVALSSGTAAIHQGGGGSGGQACGGKDLRQPQRDLHAWRAWAWREPFWEAGVLLGSYVCGHGEPDPL